MSELKERTQLVRSLLLAWEKSPSPRPPVRSLVSSFLRTAHRIAFVIRIILLVAGLCVGATSRVFGQTIAITAVTGTRFLYSDDESNSSVYAVDFVIKNTGGTAAYAMYYSGCGPYVSVYTYDCPNEGWHNAGWLTPNQTATAS